MQQIDKEPSLNEFLEALSHNSRLYHAYNSEEDSKSTLLTVILHHLYKQGNNKIKNLYLDVFSQYEPCYELISYTYGPWIPVTSEFECIASAVILNYCMKDNNALHELLWYLKDSEISELYERYNQIPDIIFDRIFETFKRVYQNLDYSFTSIRDIKKFIKGLNTTDISESTQETLPLMQLFLDIFSTSDRAFKLAWLFLSDYLDNGKFTSKTPGSMLKVLRPVVRNCYADMHRETIAFMYKAYRFKFGDKNTSEIYKLSDKHLSEYEQFSLDMYLQCNNAKSWDDICTSIKKIAVSYYSPMNWTSGLVTLSPELLEIDPDLVKQWVLNTIDVNLITYVIEDHDYTEIRQFMRNISEEHYATILPLKELTVQLLSIRADSACTKMILDQFYKQAYIDTTSLKELSVTNQHLTEKITALQEELSDLKAANYDEKMQIPVKMGLDMKEYIIQQKNSEVEALHIELATVKEEREAQNAYIDSLQKMLTDITDSQESMNQANADVIIADRVIIFGHLIGTDKQKVLQRIPRAEFIFDVNREIPSDTPVVVATARMNHALMYKIAACTNKKNIHYYNGTSMQNLYKVLLKEA